ncbi:MAG: RsiV family protein [Butyrivibrio sp.]|nr:RsiV family protein [Butyrivibrio sp.]
MRKNISLTMGMILLSTACLFGCGKEKAQKETAENANEAVSFESTTEASTEDDLANAEVPIPDKGQKITIVKHKINCKKDDKVIAGGEYPEIVFSDEMAKEYPELAKYIEELNEGWEGVSSTVSEYGAWAQEDPYSDDAYYESTVNIQIVRADDKMFTMLASFYDWAGGAHPSHYTAAYNIDPVTGEELRLENLLDDVSAFAPGVRAKLEENYPGVMEEVDSYYFKDEDDDPDEFKNKLNENSYTYTLTEKGLWIIFSPYEIASYATGYLEVELSYDEFPTLIKPEYRMDKAQDMDKMVTVSEGSSVEVEPREADSAEAVNVENPSWTSYVSSSASPKAEKHVSLEKLTEEKSDWLDRDAWASKNGFAVASSCYEDDNCFYAPYNPIEYDYMNTAINIYNKAGDELLYNFDLYNLCNGPDVESGDSSRTSQFIRFAEVYDGTLYAEIGHMGYASEESRSSYMVGIDLATGQLLFKSEPLRANADNFAIVDDSIICGYGFTYEPDYIYVLDRFTGETVSSLPVNSAAEQFNVVGDTLYVACYNTAYTYKIVK